MPRYVLYRASLGKIHQRMASQPFQECLQHTQFENWSLRESYFGESTNSTTVDDIHICENQVSRENAFARIGISTNSTIRCAAMFWMATCEEIVSKKWQFNHFKSFCNTHNSKNEVCENLILANQPIQPLFTTYIFSENPVSREINFAKIGNSTNSTTRCASMC